MQPGILDLRRVFGVEARIARSAQDTGGALVEMECVAHPGSGTMVHFHPEQDEEFEVLDGALELFEDGQWASLAAGSVRSVSRGSVHAWRNPGTIPARFRNVHRPALGFEAHLTTLDRLARAGKIRGTRDLRSLLYMSMSAARHRPDVTVKPPQWVVMAMAFIGRTVGLRLDPDGRGRTARSAEGSA